MPTRARSDKPCPPPLASRLGDDAFVAAREMKTAEHAVKRLARETLPGVRHYVDDAGVRARRQHDDALALHAHRNEPLVDHKRIGFPALPIQRAAMLALHTGFEGGDTRNLAADEEEVIQDQLRLDGVDDERTRLLKLS